MIYRWTSGSRISAEAQECGERCDWLRRRNSGELTPEIVLKDAAQSDSPLHACIEWDDAKAAQAHRLEQAAHVIRSIVAFVDDRMPEPVRAFVAVFTDPEAERKSYVAIQDAIENPALRRQLIAQALREIRLWRRRYGQYVELARLTDAIDQFDFLDDSSEVYATD